MTVEERLAAIEARLDALERASVDDDSWDEQRIADLETSLDNLHDKVRGLERRLEDMEEYN